jgi:ABC-type branched-subunit amino acid transport system permease subunit
MTVEWPEQAEGHMVGQDSVYFNRLNKMAVGFHPSDQADRDLRSLLLQAVERLWNARQERLLAAQSTIPDIVWFVVIAGGALTVAFVSFLGAPSLRMQLAMSAVLAASGALVLILIIALSNPFRGDFRVSTAPFEHVLSRMEAAAGQQ